MLSLLNSVKVQLYPVLNQGLMYVTKIMFFNNTNLQQFKLIQVDYILVYHFLKFQYYYHHAFSF